MENLTRKSNFNRVNISSENFIAAHMRKTCVKLIKPIYLGQVILDLSKTLMYEFHYDYIKPKYGNNAQLLFTDTDSLCYNIKTDNFYKDIKEDTGKWFDTSNYCKEHPLYNNKNKMVLDKMKDEGG